MRWLWGLPVEEVQHEDATGRMREEVEEPELWVDAAPELDAIPPEPWRWVLVSARDDAEALRQAIPERRRRGNAFRRLYRESYAEARVRGCDWSFDAWKHWVSL